MGLTDYGTWERGVALYWNSKVLSLMIEPSGQDWQLSGSVQGTLRSPYQLTVGTRMSDDGRIRSWVSRCTCPVHYQCKHGIALMVNAAYQGRQLLGLENADGSPILKTAEQLEAERLVLLAKKRDSERIAAESQLLLWLQRIDRASNQTNTIADADAGAALPGGADHAKPRYCLYLLSVLGHQTPFAQLRIDAVTSQIKMNGEWAKPQVLRSFPVTSSTEFRDLTPLDEDVLRLIAAMPTVVDDYHAALTLSGIPEGRTGTLALELAASTGRLFLNDGFNAPGRPLKWGPPQTLTWNWKESITTHDTDTLWTLHGSLPTPGVTLCVNKPPLYLDSRLGLCGPVEAENLSAGQLDVLLKAPAFKSSILRNQQNRLIQYLDRIPLPPVLPPLEFLKDITPIPCLHIQRAPQATTALRKGIQAQLQFDYSGHKGWWGSQPTVVTLASTDARQLLHRDVKAEREAKSQLQKLDLRIDPKGVCTIPADRSQVLWALWADVGYAPFLEAGFEVTIDEDLNGWLQHAEELIVELQADDPEAETTSPWFDLSLGVEINGERHNILPWLPTLLDQIGTGSGDIDTGLATIRPFIYLPNAKGDGYLRVSTEAIKPWLSALMELLAETSVDFSSDQIRLTPLEALRASATIGAGVVWRGAQSLRNIAQQLNGTAEIPEVSLPDSVKASLRPYQQQGLNWLQFLGQHGLGGILADDMGLGKTLQTLAHIQVEKDAGRLTHPALIIVPVSLLGNWQREANRFCPKLRTLIIHGKDRHAVAADMSNQDIVIAPYSLLQRDKNRWLQATWHLVVLDEAQHIKNATTQAAQVASQLKARQRLCLSGTPIENHLGEIWSLFHFLMPGFLGSQKRFGELFRTPIEKQSNATRLEQLRRRITPFMLRRTKARVATELPPKVETTMRVELSGKQADLYETIRVTTEKTVRDALTANGLARSHITILDALLKLRQVCCDPRLVPLSAAQSTQQSAKLSHLMEILPEMLAEGRRILLFSQFTSMLSLIEAELAARNLRWVKLTGASQKRDEIIQRFTSGEVPLFLISLKAGGVGLNLPQADTVIHYDPWWNPAAENQATDRAHRIGQTQSVWVIKLVALGTIEERILALQERKAQLADSLYSGAASRALPMFTEADLTSLLRPLSLE